ncbi:MAG: leucyl aminopeptidase [SAR202 cluster bacterium]|nr:leucyl aminopeptidase [Chloroflexota bacterium]MQG49809.1 leucyl aminopeptidase [SAR202 cluster bacterium]MQG79291.1 leucyl aminopeptidase [SAR202 cluster bacterium]|tara:strand:+ start:1317 stop:2933 length:1617 start_codon:yes stop_codon:yes gene_type:complete
MTTTAKPKAAKAKKSTKAVKSTGLKIDVQSADIIGIDTPALVVNLFRGVKKPGGATGAVDKALGGVITQLIEDGEIKGSTGETTLIHTLGKIKPSRVLVAGLGTQDKFDVQVVRRVSAEVVRFLRRKGISSAATIAHGAGIGGLDPQLSGQAIAEGAHLGLYKFGTYLTKNSDSTNEFEHLTVVESDKTRAKAIDAGIQLGSTVAKASITARNMVNEPANHMTPSRMAEAAQKVASDQGLKIEIMENAQMKNMGMGAFMGVAQGTDEPAKLIVLRYDGDPESPENNLGLIGKGITFDTGGISLKPPGGMEAMKGDMAGGASVIAAMEIIGQTKPKINVLAVIAATENMPGASAQRPGDVVRAMNGKTIEVINTDAEGRLVLADALCYAREQGITRLVDVATLTGAMVTTLGKACTGVMGNDGQLVQQTIDAGKKTGEKFWELPMFDEYKDLIKSDVADMKNSGGRQAGSISAALLLAEFVDGAAWVHLDIAGTSTSDKAAGYLVKGATGVPVRTLAQLATDLAESGAPKKSRGKTKAK